MRCLNCHKDGLPLNTQYCTNCGAHLPSLLRDVLPSGTRLNADAYEIEYALGRGGFGVTYRARHTVLEQPVAIKEFYPQELAHRHATNRTLTVPQNKQDIFQRWLQRFVREGRILTRLNHPNVVRVQDLFEENSTGYLVMELIAGRTLRQELDAQPGNKLPPQQVREIMGALVAALEAVHQAGVCHLDIKPDNILLTPEGRIVLVDFGAAKQEIGTAKQTRSTGAFTPDYAPPELSAGKPLGAESDIFELGMMLHEIIAGNLPESALSRLMGENWEPDLEEPWQSLVAAALPLARDKRPKSVREWWNTLVETRFIASGNPPPVQVPAVQVPAVARLRGNFIWPQLAQQGMVRRLGRGEIKNVIPLDEELVLVCAIGGAALFNMSPGEALWEIDCPANCGAVSPDGTRLALGGARDIYLWDLRTGQFLRRLSGHAESVYSVAFSPDGFFLASGSVDKTVRLWDVASGRQLRQLTGHRDLVRSVAFSPDGKFLASGSSDKTVQLWDVATGIELRQLTGHAGYVWSVAFTPDGKFLASGSSDNTVRLWHVATGRELRKLTGHANWVISVAFSPDGKFLASGSWDKTVRLWDVASGIQLRKLTGHAHWVISVAFSPDGFFLASGSGDITVRLWDVATGIELRQMTGHAGYVWSVAFTPDGKFLASGSSDNTVRLWHVETGRELQQLTGHAGSVYSVAFSPDGKILASGSGDKTVRLWDVATGRELQQLTGHANSVNSVEFSPDGFFLASGSHDNTVRLWDVATGRQLRLLTGHTNLVYSVAFSPDGFFLASGSHDKTVRLWDVASGIQLRQLTRHTDWVYSVAFTPDGKFLASGSRDKIVRLCDVATGSELRLLTGHANLVNSVVFSPDGKFLASGSEDGVVRLWAVGGF